MEVHFEIALSVSAGFLTAGEDGEQLMKAGDFEDLAGGALGCAQEQFALFGLQGFSGAEDGAESG